MRLFLRQLRGEFCKLWARPRTWIAFVATLALELAVAFLLRVPEVRTVIVRDLWRMRFSIEDGLSGLSIAAQLMAQAGMLIAWPCLALVAADLLAAEADGGTLRTVLARPISRGRIFAQKLLVAAAYTAILFLFIGASALAVGLAAGAPGGLVMVAIHDGVLGAFDFATGLRRYLLALGFLCASAFSIVALAFALSCFPMKPAVAAVLALGLFLADDLVRRQSPHLSPHCLTTRVQSWRQIYNDDIPWLKLRRNYPALFWFDVGVLAAGWCAFRRRDFTL